MVYSSYRTPASQAVEDARKVHTMSASKAAYLAAEIKARQAPEAPQFEDGDIVAWTKTWGIQTYNYAAIHAAGEWFVTGRQQVAKSWDDLCVDLARKGVTNVRIARKFDAVDI